MSLISNSKGLSLIEMIFTILILALALAGIANSLSGGMARSSDTLREIQAVALAQSYLDEIVGKRFDEGNRPSGIPPCRGTLPDGAPRRCSEESGVPPPRLFGPDGTETRATYDDVDDYDGLSEGFGEVNPLQDANGDSRGTEYASFRVEIEVTYYDGSGTDVEYTPTTPVDEELDDMYDAKLIQVTVFYADDSEGFVFSVYKSNF